MTRPREELRHALHLVNHIAMNARLGRFEDQNLFEAHRLRMTRQGYFVPVSATEFRLVGPLSPPNLGTVLPSPDGYRSDYATKAAYDQPGSLPRSVLFARVADQRLWISARYPADSHSLTMTLLGNYFVRHTIGGRWKRST